MATTTTTKTIPSNSVFFDDVKLAMPIYVSFTKETAKKILNTLHAKCKPAAAMPNIGGASLQVETFTISDSQLELEQRLRVDLKTLRMILFESWTRGITLDLANRIQAEIRDEVEFLTAERLEEAFKQSLAHYDYFSHAKKTKGK